MDELDSIHQTANCQGSQAIGSRSRTVGPTGNPVETGIVFRRDGDLIGSVHAEGPNLSTPQETNLIEWRGVDEKGQYTEDTLKKYPLLTDAVQRVLKQGYSAIDIKPIVSMILSDKGWDCLTTQNILGKLNTPEQIQSMNKRKANKKQRDSERKMKEECLSMEEVKAENRALHRKLTCQQCNGTVDVMFLPCGHVSGCSSCGIKKKRCPVCEQYYNTTLRVLLRNR